MGLEKWVCVVIVRGGGGRRRRDSGSTNRGTVLILSGELSVTVISTIIISEMFDGRLPYTPYTFIVYFMYRGKVYCSDIGVHLSPLLLLLLYLLMLIAN